MKTYDTDTPPFSLPTPFDKTVGLLLRGLRELYLATTPTIDFTTHAKQIKKKLDEGGLASDLIDQYVAGQVDGHNLAHFIEASLALAIEASSERDSGESESAWLKLCHAFFVGGMATLQLNLTRGPNLRTEPYRPFKRAILQLIEIRCPPEKWESLDAMWRAIEASASTANELLLGQPGFSRDPRGVFDRLAKDKRATFQLYLSSPVKRGRPKKRKAE